MLLNLKKSIILFVLMVFIAVRSQLFYVIFDSSSQDKSFNTVKQNFNIIQSRSLTIGAIAAKAFVGFTLAEILVALAVVGVLAAIVVPGLVESAQNQELFTSFKKIYAEIGNAAIKAKTDNGGTLEYLSQTPICQTKGYYGNGDAAARCDMEVLSGYLNYSNKCPNGGSCSLIYGPYYLADGVNTVTWINVIMPKASITLGTRATISFCNGTSDSCKNSSTYSVTGDEVNGCSNIWVDVNGLKGPNRIGRDVFIIYLSKDGVSAPSAPDNSNYCNPKGDYWRVRGMGCAKMLLTTGKTYE